MVTRVPPWPPPPPATGAQQIPRDLVNRLATLTADDEVVAATDGGTGYGISTWAIHIHHLRDGSMDTSKRPLGTWTAVVQGEDQSNWAAETAAASILLRAARDSKTKATIRWVYDSKSVADAIQKFQSTARLGMETLLAHTALLQCGSQGAVVTATWCTSHNKRFPSGWQPPAWADEFTLRATNKVADDTCSATRDSYAASTGRVTIDAKINDAIRHTNNVFDLAGFVAVRWAKHSIKAAKPTAGQEEVPPAPIPIANA